MRIGFEAVSVEEGLGGGVEVKGGIDSLSVGSGQSLLVENVVDVGVGVMLG